MKKGKYTDVKKLQARLNAATTEMILKNVDRAIDIQERLLGVVEDLTERVTMLERHIGKVETPARIDGQAEASGTDRDRSVLKIVT